MALHTETELKKMTKQSLGELAEDYGFDSDDPYTKASAIEYILENQVEDDELDDDELDDEVDDTEVDDDELDDEVDDEDIPEEDEIDDEEPEPSPKKKKPAAKKKPDIHDGEETLAAKQVAALLKTDAKTLRQFLRSPASTIEAVGSGGRYEFLESQVDQIRNEFAAWMENKKTRTRTKSEGGSTRRSRKERVIPEEEIAEEVIDLEDELDELEDELDELEWGS